MQTQTPDLFWELELELNMLTSAQKPTSDSKQTNLFPNLRNLVQSPFFFFSGSGGIEQNTSGNCPQASPEDRLGRPEPNLSASAAIILEKKAGGFLA